MISLHLRFYALVCCLCFWSVFASSQNVGSIVGTVIDKDSEIPLPGANIVVTSYHNSGVTTDSKGNFRVSGIPVGRHTLQVSFVGYKTAVFSNVDVTSGKDQHFVVALEQLIFMHDDVVIKADIRKDRPQNDMALISARTFSVEETEKYAGSFGDPARMAATYAGVMQGGDQLNEIVIRGNSPAGLLYRLNGVSIPNPTHFSSAGTSGGAISILNSNTLSNSDFYTGAFPAEFGNALSGVFDLRMRTGNSSRREYLFQMGFNGFELGLEGPYSKKRNSTYLIHYRYSTLEVFDWLGLPLPVSSIPYFQDITLNTAFPTKRIGTFSIFLVAGKNHITFERVQRDTINSASRFGSETAILGLNHQVFVRNSIKISSGVALTHRADYSTDTARSVNGVITNWYGHESWERRVQFHSSVRIKLNNQNTLNAGFEYYPGWVLLTDSTLHIPSSTFIYINKTKGDYSFGQSFVQLKHKFSDDFALVTGLHHQYLSINQQHVVEPRLSVSYDANQNNTFSLGLGMHSQMLPRHIYFVESLVDTVNQIYMRTNKNLGFSKSKHIVAGHQFLFKRVLRVKTEAYYQHLSQIPVEQRPSYFSMINYGSFGLEEGNNTDSLVNAGDGYNLGLEFTLERFSLSGWYVLFTASLYESKYRGSDLVWRNTLFNSNFVFNWVGGYEISLSKNHRISFDVKSVWAGGLRKLPIDFNASVAQGRTVYDYSSAFEKRHGDYFRFDFKVSFRLNFSRVSHSLAIELMNATNRKNHFIQSFNPTLGQIEESTQLGLTPVAMYRIVF